MTKSEIKRQVFAALSSFIESNGFKLDRKNEVFILTAEDSIYIYDLLFYDRTNIRTGEKGVQVEPYVWINVLQISKYYKEITINTYLKKEIHFKVLGGSVAEIKANPDGIHKKWNETLGLMIFNEKDILPVSKELINQFKKVALPYFSKNGSVSMVDKYANGYPLEKIVHMSHDCHRIIYGLIAAKLNKNPQLENLISVYEKVILDDDMPEDCKEELERLKSILPMIGKDLSF